MVIRLPGVAPFASSTSFPNLHPPPRSPVGNSCRSLADLEEAARRAATAATQCVNSSRNSTPYNTNENAQQSLLAKSKTVAQDSVPALVLALKQSVNNAGDPAAQRELVNEAKKVTSWQITRSPNHGSF